MLFYQMFHFVYPIQSYLPSLDNSNQKEDVEKWQNLIQERNNLKGILKNNYE